MKFVLLLLSSVTLACSGFAQKMQVGLRMGVYQSYNVKFSREVLGAYTFDPVFLKYDPYNMLLSPSPDKSIFTRLRLGKAYFDLSFSENRHVYQSTVDKYYVEPGCFGGGYHAVDYRSYWINISHLDLAFERSLFTISRHLSLTAGINANLNFLKKKGNTIIYNEEAQHTDDYGTDNTNTRLFRIGLSETLQYYVSRHWTLNLAFRQTLAPEVFSTRRFYTRKYPFLGCSYAAGLGYNLF